MEQNQKGARFLKRLAEIADLTQNTYKGKATVVFELGDEEYQKTMDQIPDVDWTSEEFKVEISGTDFIFLHQRLSPSDTDNP